MSFCDFILTGNSCHYLNNIKIKKKIQAPWVPDIADPLDTSNFESLDDAEDEDFLKDKAPLTAKEQLVFQDF